VWFIRALLLLLGCFSAIVGLYMATKFGGELLDPESDDAKRARFPVCLLIARLVGSGAAFIVAGIARSKIAVYCGAGIWLSSAAIAWVDRRLRRTTEFDPPT
jgi:hypothetical protein